jgi:inorganic pyrophosphatase/exopolyphosphatase
MTPKEKAKELVREFKKYAYYPKTKDDELFVKEIKENSKQCALIAVDEIIKTICYCYPINEYEISFVEYWQEVKQEIEKL